MVDHYVWIVRVTQYDGLVWCIIIVRGGNTPRSALKAKCSVYGCAGGIMTDIGFDS